MKSFLITLFIKQNKYHKYSVLGHTLSVARQAIKNKRYDLIASAIFHDIGKPVVAHQRDIEDQLNGTYSFTGHEEKSYQIIKNWFFLSERTKLIVRHHYLITGMASDYRKYIKTNEERFVESYQNRFKIWSSLDKSFQEQLLIFKIFDDNGKGYKELEKAVPAFLKERLDKVEKKLVGNI
jgi:predicted HD phosphohydrolase